MANKELLDYIDEQDFDSFPDPLGDVVLVRKASGLGKKVKIANLNGGGVVPAPIPTTETMDLDAEDGNIITATGTADVETIILSEGVRKRVTYEDLAVLIHSASLQVPGEANLIVQPGDSVWFLGLGGGDAIVESIRRKEIEPLGGKVASTQIVTRIVSMVSTSTFAPDADTTDEVHITALAEDFFLNAIEGTPTDSQDMRIRIKDDGTGDWNLTYHPDYRFLLHPAPTKTVAGKTIYLDFERNEDDGVWDLVNLEEEASYIISSGSISPLLLANNSGRIHRLTHLAPTAELPPPEDCSVGKTHFYIQGVFGPFKIAVSVGSSDIIDSVILDATASPSVLIGDSSDLAGGTDGFPIGSMIRIDYVRDNFWAVFGGYGQST